MNICTWVQGLCEDERPESWTYAHKFNVYVKINGRSHEHINMNLGLMWRWTDAAMNIHTWIRRLCDDERPWSWTYAHEFNVLFEAKRPETWTFTHELRVYMKMNNRCREDTHMNVVFSRRWTDASMNIQTWTRRLCGRQRTQSRTYTHEFSVYVKMNSRTCEHSHMLSGFIWRWIDAVMNIHACSHWLFRWIGTDAEEIV